MGVGRRPCGSRWLVCHRERRRDWKYDKTADDVVNLSVEAGSAAGQGFRWVWQLIGLKEGTR